MIDAIIILIIIAAVGGALAYIRKQKKSGAHCIGCSGGACVGCSGGVSGSCDSKKEA